MLCGIGESAKFCKAHQRVGTDAKKTQQFTLTNAINWVRHFGSKHPCPRVLITHRKGPFCRQHLNLACYAENIWKMV